MNNKTLQIIEHLVSIILGFYCPQIYAQYRPEIRIFFKRAFQLASDRGIPFMIKYVKSSRLAVTRYLSGHPLTEVEGISLDGGWPVWLSPFKPLIETVPGKKLLMTLLVSFRGLHTKAVLDLGPIESKWGGSLPNITSREFNHICRQLGIRSTEVSWKSFHMSTKSGPNGQSLTSSVTDLTFLPQELISSIKILGGVKLGRVIDELLRPRFGNLSIASIWATIFSPKTSRFRKLSYFSDKEGKTRVIAILDYWSQTCLRPYHDAINRVLRKIPSDCTYNQNSIFETLPTSGPYFSLDLSNATDRMPLALQSMIFERMFGEEKAKAWSSILVGWEYTLKGGSSVSYNTGQPMGAYSSWSAMALTHHFIVRLAALRSGYPHFTSYCLLGDDLVIANAAVAAEYRRLCSVLDMPISEQKTHISKDIFEFAKRWFISGIEFTGFSISGLFSVWKSYALLHNYLETQRLHGWSLEIDKHPGLISAIYSLLGKFQQVERVNKLYMVFDSLSKEMNTESLSELSMRVEQYFGIQTSSLVSPPLGETHATIAYKAIVAAKKKIVERDIGRFQKDAYSVSAKLTGSFLKKFPDLSVPDYRAALRGIHPLVTVLNAMILESANKLQTQFGRSIVITTARSSQVQAIAGPDVQVQDTAYLEAGLSKYFVSKGVFTMRASHSIVLTKAQVVKGVLTEFRNLVNTPRSEGL